LNKIFEVVLDLLIGEKFEVILTLDELVFGKFLLGFTNGYTLIPKCYLNEHLRDIELYLTVPGNKKRPILLRVHFVEIVDAVLDVLGDPALYPR
jgi:hypothetical protein